MHEGNHKKLFYYADEEVEIDQPLTCQTQDCPRCYGAGVVEQFSDDDYLCFKCDYCRGFGYFWVPVD